MFKRAGLRELKWGKKRMRGKEKPPEPGPRITMEEGKSSSDVGGGLVGHDRGGEQYRGTRKKKGHQCAVGVSSSTIRTQEEVKRASFTGVESPNFKNL